MIFFLSEDYQSKAKFIGACDRVRQTCSDNEKFWHVMMDNKKEIDVRTFMSKTDYDTLLDEDENFSDYINDLMREDKKTSFYQSTWGGKKCFFIYSGGFEFIFVEDQTLLN